MYGSVAAYKNIYNDIKEAMGSRIDHVVGCMKECLNISNALGITGYDKFRLAISALLHDVTHHLTAKEQLEFCQKHGIVLDKDTLESPNTIHAKTGAVYAKLTYPHIVDEVISENIESHTVGCENMTVCQKVLCLADYIEETRKYQACQQMRRWFWHNLSLPDQNKNAVLGIRTKMHFWLRHF